MGKPIPPEDPEKKKEGHSRREFINRVAMWTVPLAAGGILAVDAQRSSEHEYNERSEAYKKPLKRFRQVQMTLPELVKDLKKKGTQGFCFGTHNHFSAKPEDSISTVLEMPEIDIRMVFIEDPESHLKNPKADAAIAAYFAGNDAADKERTARELKFKSELEKQLRKIDFISCDTHQGPGADQMIEYYRLNAKGNVLEEVINKAKLSLDYKEYKMAEQYFNTYRNYHMAEKITECLKAAKKENKHPIFAYCSGAWHITAEHNVPSLLREALPELKVATIEILPLKDKSYENLVFQSETDPRTFMVTRHDPEHGFDFFKPNVAGSLEEPVMLLKHKSFVNQSREEVENPSKLR